MEQHDSPSYRPFRVKLGDGVEVEVATEAEVIALLVEAGILPRRGGGSGTSSANRPRTPRAPLGRKRLFIDLLRLLAVRKRLSLDEIYPLLGLKGPRGIAPFITGWRKVFEAAGLELDQVIVHQKDRQRNVWWEPGAELEKGITILEAAAD